MRFSRFGSAVPRLTLVALVALLADSDIQAAVRKIIAVLRPQAE